jgi:hypothetical protein
MQNVVMVECTGGPVVTAEGAEWGRYHRVYMNASLIYHPVILSAVRQHQEQSLNQAIDVREFHSFFETIGRWQDVGTPPTYPAQKGDDSETLRSDMDAGATNGCVTGQCKSTNFVKATAYKHFTTKAGQMPNLQLDGLRKALLVQIARVQF